ncbi:MAG: hypothetical protein DRJ33_08575 [Candidatus Methanomethylicota archaeon]|uniref:DUF434 domain-containing protein n=1 Tax=Thermoproteota archaeon TaxID=2056631 RepID=A0A497ENS9_9CREN|nr:MAG: hypothetical protein DRJ33_08575 [Candidatus Verstraetearchaeota archaeon]
MNDKLTKAAIDARYLLSRGYNREAVVRFVGDRYLLSREERLAIYRGIYDPITALIHRKKKVSKDFLAGRVLAVDGFNVLITVETALLKKPLLLCDDGFIRDVSAIHGCHVFSDVTYNALNVIARHVSELKLSSVLFFYDSPISHSGDIAKLTRETVTQYGVRCNAYAVKQVDSEVLKSGEVVASSDYAIISRANFVYDLGGEAIQQFKLILIKL